jgi:hypothetical protein
MTTEELNPDLLFEPDDESDEEVSYYDYDDEEEESTGSPPPRQSNSQASQALQAEIDSYKTKVSELEDRLGNALRVHGERLKERDREIDEWLENVTRWHESEMVSARQGAFEEGARSVEKRLLPMLGPEEKADYLEDVRIKPVTVSPQPIVPLDTKRKNSTSDATEDVHALVEQFIASGVPIDRLEQTSAEAVVRSGTGYLVNRTSEIEERLTALDQKLEGRVREESGATRVSSGTGGGVRLTVSGDQKRLEEIAKQLKVMRGRGNLDAATKLLNEKKQIEARLAEARRRRA